MPTFQSPTIRIAAPMPARLVLRGNEVQTLVAHFAKMQSVGAAMPPDLRDLVNDVLFRAHGVEDFVSAAQPTIQEAAEQAVSADDDIPY